MTLLNQYANNMFRFEHLNDAWIEQCAAYLRQVFSDLEGKTVLDYAFGRGNWSLAFRRAGASRVVAVDAAIDNVRRFSIACRDRGTTGVAIKHGNLLEGTVDLTPRGFDVIWTYGILPCIEEPQPFIQKLREHARDEARLLFYAYDRGSLRQFAVDTCRRAAVFRSEYEFAAEAPVLTRAARLRARDDLTAPVVTWDTAGSLASVLERCGIYPIGQPSSFHEFQRGRQSEEFRPHHLLCALAPTHRIVPREWDDPYRVDIDVLDSMGRVLLERVPKKEARTKVALGLFNAHFSALDADGSAGPVLIEDFLHLFYLLLREDVAATDMPEPASSIYRLAIESLRDAPRSAPSSGGHLARYLASTRIRI